MFNIFSSIPRCLLATLGLWLSVTPIGHSQTGISGDGDPSAEPTPISRPAATITITPAAGSSDNYSPITTQPVAKGSVFTQVLLPFSSSGQSALATTTLSYGSAFAGQPIWVQPLRGGICTSPTATGSATVGNGFAVTLDANGKAVLTFQPPNKPGTYKVLTRSLNANTFFSFVVATPDT